MVASNRGVSRRGCPGCGAQVRATLLEQLGGRCARCWARFVMGEHETKVESLDDAKIAGRLPANSPEWADVLEKTED